MMPAVDARRLLLPGPARAVRGRALLAALNGACGAAVSIIHAALLAVVVLGAAALARAEAPKRSAPAEPSAQSDRALKEAWAIRSTGRTVNGTFNQDAIVAEQKKRAGVLSDAMGMKFRLFETPHYLVVSDAEAARAALFAKWCEPLYANLSRSLGMPLTQRVWDGKCMIFLFNAQKEFEDFAARFDHVDATRRNAYYWVEGLNPAYPTLIHLAFSLQAGDQQALQNLLTHEGAHTFFAVYQGRVRLPLWLDEGLAVYMALLNDPTLRQEKADSAAEIAKSGRSLREFLERPPDGVLTKAEYALAWSLVDYLMEASRPKFKQLINAIKGGQDERAAVKTAYGFDLEEFVSRWRAARGGEGPAKPGTGEP